MSYFYEYDPYGFDGFSAGLFGGLATGILVMYWIIGMAVAALAIVAMWKIFVKAGEEGWAAIVPFYNMYILFKISWGNGLMALILLSAIIPILGWIACMVIMIMTYIKLAKAFGKGGGFACGLIFLNTIFMCILAFDKNIHYIGVPDKAEPDYSAYNAPGGFNSPGGYAAGGFVAGGAAAGGADAGFTTNYEQTQARFTQPYQQQSEQNADYHYQRTEAPEAQKTEAEKTATGGFCPQCGAKLEPGTKFCHNCGSKL